MRIFIRKLTVLLVPLIQIAPGTSDAGETLLQLNSSTPDINITARSNDGAAIKLPKLAYAFHIEAECAAEQAPQSLLLSIADTQKRVAGDRLQDGTEVTITIPADQIAPLTIADFCLSAAGPEQQQKSPVTVHGALSAQVALLCSDGNQEQMIYASLALDVTLHCIDKKPAVDE